MGWVFVLFGLFLECMIFVGCLVKFEIDILELGIIGYLVIYRWFVLGMIGLGCFCGELVCIGFFILLLLILGFFIVVGILIWGGWKLVVFGLSGLEVLIGINFG